MFIKFKKQNKTKHTHTHAHKRSPMRLKPESVRGRVLRTDQNEIT